jgi:Flp pilus assembly protein TadD
MFARVKDRRTFMEVSHSSVQAFVRQTVALMACDDEKQLESYLRAHWPVDRLCEVLQCDDDNAVKIAAVCLFLVGTMEATPALTHVLHHDDPTVAGFAEHALWAIWFRAAGDQCQDLLNQAVQFISDAHMEQAIFLLKRALERSPDFAEAHNQLAIALFLCGGYEEAIDSCKEALRLNPYHFGAMAGMGHCYASMGQFDQAMQAYRCALQIQPRMNGIRQAMAQVRKAAERGLRTRPSDLGAEADRVSSKRIDRGKQAAP